MGNSVQLLKDPPPLCFLPAAWLKLQLITDLAPGEVGGFGLIDVGDEQFTVLDVLLPEQTCSAGSTAVDPAGVASLLAELADEGEDLGRVHLWFHSHANGEAYLSDRDRRTLGEDFPQADYMVGLVVNKRGGCFASLYCYRPLALIAEPLRVMVLGSRGGGDLREEVNDEVARKVRPPVTPAVADRANGSGAAVWQVTPVRTSYRLERR